MKHNYSKIIYEDAKRDKALFVDWSLGNHCNFSCSYCPTNLHDGSAPWLSLQECEKFIYNMILHYKTLDKKYFIFNLLGGEPTVWRHIEKFCLLIKKITSDNNVIASIEVLTNGGRTMRWWHNNHQIFDVYKITHHCEFANPNHTKKLAEFLYENKHPVSIQIPFDPNSWDNCMEHLEIISDSDSSYSINLKTLLVDFGATPYSYTDEQRDFIVKYDHLSSPRGQYNLVITNAHTADSWQGPRIDKVIPSRVLINNEHSWLNWKCWAGTDLIQIDHTGQMKLGGACRVKYPNFTQKFITEDFKFPTKPVTCTQKWCPCGVDILVKKEKIND